MHEVAVGSWSFLSSWQLRHLATVGTFGPCELWQLVQVLCLFTLCRPGSDPAL